MDQPQQTQQPQQHLHHHQQGRPGHHDILSTPVWLLVVRIVQAVFSFIVLCLAATVIHDAYIDELGLALAISLITVLAVAYIVLAEKVEACRPAYHVLAVLVLDGLLLVLWLATFAAVAARRSRFVFDVTVDGCYNNGGLVNSTKCFAKRGVVLFKSGGDMMAGAAGIGALVWILFIVSSVWTLVHFLRGRKEGRFPLGTGAPATVETTQMESKIEQQQPQPQPQSQPQQQYPTPLQQTPVNSQYQHPTPTQSPPPPSVPSPYQHQPAYSPPPHGTYPAAELHTQQNHHPYGQHPSPQQYSHSELPSYQQPGQPMGSELPAQQPQTYQHQ